MSTTGYFPDLHFPRWFEGPETFRLGTERLWRGRYADLYEEADERPTLRLAEALESAVTLLHDDDSRVHHRRCMFAGLTLGKACEPTVEGWRRGDPRPKLVLAAVEAALAGTAPVPHDWATVFPREVAPPQALHEALDVFWNLARMLDAACASAALLEMLEDCFDGYAIVPGSDGKRDLFNWLLCEVLPSAWATRLPDRIYSLHWRWPP